ncbi:hypothetical protein Tco_0243001 [Tanacetum coccineum]
MSFSKRSDNAPVCYTKPLDSFKNWNNHFFWVDTFACPVSFPWHTTKHVTRDPDPIADNFNAHDYATLVAHLSPNGYLCIHSYSESYQIAPNRADNELEASVERLFDKGGSGNQIEQGDSVVDVGGASHPSKKLREDHGTPSVAYVGGKFRSAIKRLLVGDVLNVEVGVAAIPTLPFVTAYVSSMPEREAGDHTDSVAKPNLRTIGASQRFVISSDSSHHFSPTIAEAEVDSLVNSSVPIITTVTTVTSTVDPALVVKERPVKPSLFFADSSSAGGADPNTGVFSNLTGSDFLVGGIRTVIDPDTDLQKVYVRQWSVTNGSHLDDGHVSARQMCLNAEVRMRAEYNVKEKKREAEAVKAIRLRAEASNFETVKKSLRVKAETLKERNAILEKERSALDVKVTDLEASAMRKDRELTDLNALVTSVKSQNDILADRKVTVYENCMEQLEKFQDDRMKVVNDKFDKLYTDFVEMALHLEEKFYPHLLTTSFGRRWLLTQGMKLAITKCLNSPEYLFGLGASIGKAIEKGIQDGLSTGITHGKEGRVLTDVAAYNPSAEVYYTSTLQQFQNVNFPLPAELKSNKDASIESVTNILRLEEPFADKLGLGEIQPHIDQLMVPIHHSPDKVVIGATALSLALDVSSTEGTSDTVPATTDGTTTLSTTFAFESTISPISVDDYEVVDMDDVTPPKSGRSGMVTMGCYFKVQQSRYRKRP